LRIVCRGFGIAAVPEFLGKEILAERRDRELAGWFDCAGRTAGDRRFTIVTPHEVGQRGVAQCVADERAFFVFGFRGRERVAEVDLFDDELDLIVNSLREPSLETSASICGRSATVADTAKFFAASLLTCLFDDDTNFNNGATGNSSPRCSATCSATAISDSWFEATMRANRILNSSGGTVVSRVSAPSCTLGPPETMETIVGPAQPFRLQQRSIPGVLR
jgi:hypothetical protein